MIAETIDPAEPRLWDLLARLIEPGQRVTPDVWAEKNLRLSPRETRFSGPLRFDRTPYMRGPLRALVEPRYRRVLLCWAAQLGKTTVEQIWLSFVIDQDPGPAMLALPNRQFTKRRSRTHLQPMITGNPVIARHIAKRPDAIQNFEFAFDRMNVNLAWAGSSTMMASEPVRWLIRDEIEKWKHLDKTEGHPLDLAAERVKSFDDLAKILDASTPGLKSGQTITTLEEGTFHRFFVPCPHCGKPDDVADLPELVTDQTVEQLKPRLAAAGYQVLSHDGFTGHEGLTDPDEIRKRTVYRCEHCKETFAHSHVRSITQRGKWIPRRVNVPTFTSHLPTWYRDLESCSFGECQAKFEAAKGDPIELQNWINSIAAEGWEEMGVERSKDEIRAHCRDYAWQTIPFVPVYVFMTVDIRDTEIHLIVRAWSHGETSALLGHYLLPRLTKYDASRSPTGESLANVDEYLGRTFPCVDGNSYGISLTAIDSGDDTDEVYEYCRTRPRCVAMKGDEKLAMTLGVSRPQKIWGTKDPAPDSCFLIAFQSGYFSDVLNARMNVSPNAPGDWKLPNEVGDDYCTHMVSERKVTVVNKWGRSESRWKRFGKANHWRDCEKMQFVLARYLDIRSIKPAAPKQDAPPQPTAGFVGRDTSALAERLNRR